MARKTGLRWQVFVAAGIALALTGAGLALALIAAAATQSNGELLGQRLIPAAAGTGSLLSRYDEEATWLRGYVTSSRPGSRRRSRRRNGR